MRAVTLCWSIALLAFATHAVHAGWTTIVDDPDPSSADWNWVSPCSNNDASLVASGGALTFDAGTQAVAGDKSLRYSMVYRHLGQTLAVATGEVVEVSLDLTPGASIHQFHKVLHVTLFAYNGGTPLSGNVNALHPWPQKLSSAGANWPTIDKATNDGKAFAYGRRTDISNETSPTRSWGITTSPTGDDLNVPHLRKGTTYRLTLRLTAIQRPASQGSTTAIGALVDWSTDDPAWSGTQRTLTPVKDTDLDDWDGLVVGFASETENSNHTGFTIDNVVVRHWTPDPPAPAGTVVLVR